MESEKMKYLLCALLDCSPDDLSVLSHAEFSFSDIIERTKDIDNSLDLGGLFFGLISLGRDKIDSAINMKMGELNKLGIDEITSEQIDELDKLQSLDVSADISAQFNYHSSEVHLISNQDIYEDYLKAELLEFENMTGFQIQI